MYISNLKQAYKLLGTIVGTAWTAMVASLEEKNWSVALGLAIELVVHMPIIIVAALVAPIAIVIPQVRAAVIGANEKIAILKPMYENIAQMNRETWKLIYEIACMIYGIMDWLRTHIIEPVVKTGKMVGGAVAEAGKVLWWAVTDAAKIWWDVVSGK